MKKALLISIILAKSFNAFSQCNQHFNGNFESTSIDSFYNKIFSKWGWYYLPNKCMSAIGLSGLKDNNSQLNPDTFLLSENSYEGNYALIVEREPFTIGYGNSFIRDTFSSKVAGLNGYYKTDSLFKTSELLISFLVHNSPTVVYRNQTADTLMIETFLLESTNGIYKYFEVDFDRNRNVLQDSFILSFNWIIDFDNEDETTDEFVLFDNLSFECPTSVSDIEQYKNFKIERTNDGYTVKGNNLQKFDFRIFNINGQLIKNGTFSDELFIDKTNNFLFLQIIDNQIPYTFKLFY